MKKVFVTNIPVRGTVEGWVEVPDGTDEEGLQDAVEKSLRDGSWDSEAVHEPGCGLVAGLELDLAERGDYEFAIPLGAGG